MQAAARDPIGERGGGRAIVLTRVSTPRPSRSRVVRARGRWVCVRRSLALALSLSLSLSRARASGRGGRVQRAYASARLRSRWHSTNSSRCSSCIAIELHTSAAVLLQRSASGDMWPMNRR
eukprot:390788-Prymnesium_polylepis.2